MAFAGFSIGIGTAGGYNNGFYNGGYRPNVYVQPGLAVGGLYPGFAYGPWGGYNGGYNRYNGGYNGYNRGYNGGYNHHRHHGRSRWW